MALGRKPGLRLQTADRSQTGFDVICLDDLLGPEHRARSVWSYVERCDLSLLYDRVRAVEGEVGRPPIDPAILLSLWLYATLEGVGSARLLARLCASDAAYRWLCGGVSVNHHTLADFRFDGCEVLDRLLTRSMAALVDSRVVELECLAVDGVRVRASAGRSSFRSKSRLKQLHALAEQKVAALKAELKDDPGAAADRVAQRKLGEAQARKARIEAAQQAAEEIEEQRQREAEEQRRKKPKKQAEPRASTTDPEARVMKMADGAFHPAYNFQVKTDPKRHLIVGLDATNSASDRGKLLEAIGEVEQRYHVRPAQVLADGGYGGKADIEALHELGVEVFSPVPGSKGKTVPVKVQKGDGPGVIAWRERMSREENLTFYRRRFACERPHADMRNRGLRQLLVRGLAKARAVALWYATAYNFLQIQRLEAQAP